MNFMDTGAFALADLVVNSVKRRIKITTIQMNAKQVITIAMNMRHASILLMVFNVNVIVDFMEMEKLIAWK